VSKADNLTAEDAKDAEIFFIIYYFFQIFSINIMGRENVKKLGEKNAKKI